MGALDSAVPINGLSEDMADDVARFGVDPTLAPAPLRTALVAAITKLGGTVRWEADGSNWRAVLWESERFGARSIEQALGWCLLYLNAPEYGIDDDFL